jgi:hypothetical protein
MVRVSHSEHLKTLSTQRLFGSWKYPCATVRGAPGSKRACQSVARTIISLGAVAVLDSCLRGLEDEAAQSDRRTCRPGATARTTLVATQQLMVVLSRMFDIVI